MQLQHLRSYVKYPTNLLSLGCGFVIDFKFSLSNAFTTHFLMCHPMLIAGDCL